MPHSAPTPLGEEHVISACSSVNEPTELQGAESKQQREKPPFCPFPTSQALGRKWAASFSKLYALSL